MSAYPFASSAKVTETLGVLETSNIATTQQTLLQQILVACGVTGGPPPPTPPATPTGFTATAQESAVLLSWDAQPEADTFEIYFGTTNVFGSASLLTAAATGTSFTHNVGNGIQPGQKYFYWVRAVNTDGESAWSSSITARSFVTVAPSGSASLTTPTGSWTWGSILFSTTSPPDDFQMTLGSVSAVFSGGSWYDLDTFSDVTADPFSGAFTAFNLSGTSFTFWNTEP